MLSPKKFIGNVCKDHPDLKGERYISNRDCPKCIRRRLAASRKRNRAKETNRIKQWKKLNPDKVKASSDRYRAKNPGKLEASKAAWRLANPDKYRAQRLNSNTIRRRLIGGQALAKYYSKEIRLFYQNCPEGHHVDHIVALRGNGVCGLHVPWNLQYLPGADNIKKGNK